MGTAIRFIRDSDITAVQALSSQLFPWKEEDAFDLGACISAYDRWLCLAAAHSPVDGSNEQLVGFVVAAIGFVSEYTADRERLVAWLTGPDVTWHDAEGWAAAATAAEADATLAVQVCLLGVTDAFRRQRIASTLMARTENWARSRGAQLLFLYVDPTEAGALQFYARHGFAPACNVPNYYAPGRAALLYVMRIDGGTDWEDWSDASEASSAQQVTAGTFRPSMFHAGWWAVGSSSCRVSAGAAVAQWLFKMHMKPLRLEGSMSAATRPMKRRSVRAACFVHDHCITARAVSCHAYSICSNNLLPKRQMNIMPKHNQRSIRLHSSPWQHARHRTCNHSCRSTFMHALSFAGIC